MKKQKIRMFEEKKNVRRNDDGAVMKWVIRNIVNLFVKLIDYLYFRSIDSL